LLLLNGEKLLEVEGEDFGGLYPGIRLDENPVSPLLKEALLSPISPPPPSASPGHRAPPPA
jgi:hypothetical protein